MDEEGPDEDAGENYRGDNCEHNDRLHASAQRAKKEKLPTEGEAFSSGPNAAEAISLKPVVVVAARFQALF